VADLFTVYYYHQIYWSCF